MDKTSIFGIILGVLSVLFGLYFKGTSFGVLLNPAAIIIIFAGTAATILIGFPGKEIKRIPKLFGVLFKDRKEPDVNELIKTFSDLSAKARQEGLLSLEQEVESTENPFLKQGLKMIVDGQEPSFIRDTMEEELNAIEERHASGAQIFTQAGTYAPTLGVLGAVLGLIAALGDLNDIDALGYAIAAAFVATLYGIFTGYVLWHPFANKLKRKSKDEVMIKSIIIEGVLSIQAGVPPRAVKDKLIVYVPQVERAKVGDGASQGESVNG
ncbi:flagellar motor rotation protein MotA [Halalkalibacter wakoensis JCM 9140]|uniref:Flagellar motor rotation protein MotA n=1 Tax=Halalkalibacter wakoensis JCM 9140 TaxID=1236970 RepID=W4Q375_9BACI|nr:flagellar motor stator protein MotA [Halalkalibacter wakoensis]GAE26526.1 flagellar motor rotation protein MotA [Halalkalibacter wakoensis JCM 9140]